MACPHSKFWGDVSPPSPSPRFTALLSGSITEITHCQGLSLYRTNGRDDTIKHTELLDTAWRSRSANRDDSHMDDSLSE